MFGQKFEKMIIVVAPDKYKAVAREMTHQLSKLENCNAAYWTIKHFEDNEMQIGAKHWILSIGNSSENKLTSDYRSFIKLKHDAGGLCYGYDGNKAIMFADEKKVDKNDTIRVAKNLGLINGAGVSTGVISSGLIAGGLFVPLFNIALPAVLIRNYFKKKKKIEEFLKVSTSLTADLFLKEGVEVWFNHNEKEEL